MENAMSAAVRSRQGIGSLRFGLHVCSRDGHRYSCRRSWMALRLDTWSPASWGLRDDEPGINIWLGDRGRRRGHRGRRRR